MGRLNKKEKEKILNYLKKDLKNNPLVKVFFENEK